MQSLEVIGMRVQYDDKVRAFIGANEPALIVECGTWDKRLFLQIVPRPSVFMKLIGTIAGMAPVVVNKWFAQMDCAGDMTQADAIALLELCEVAMGHTTDRWVVEIAQLMGTSDPVGDIGKVWTAWKESFGLVDDEQEV